MSNLTGFYKNIYLHIFVCIVEMNVKKIKTPISFIIQTLFLFLHDRSCFTHYTFIGVVNNQKIIYIGWLWPSVSGETVMLLWSIQLPKEYLLKSFSVNTAHRFIQKCNLKLYYIRRKPYSNTEMSLCPENSAVFKHRRTERQWTRVLWSDQSRFQLLLGKNWHLVLRITDLQDHPG